MKLKVRQKGNTYQVIDSERAFGEISFRSRLSCRANIKLYDSESIRIEPKGRIGNVLSIKQNENELAQITMRWSGSVDIEYSNETLSLNSNGIFNRKHALKSNDKRLRMKFDTKNTQGDRYTLITNNDDKLLALIGICAIKHKRLTLFGVSVALALPILLSI